MTILIHFGMEKSRLQPQPILFWDVLADCWVAQESLLQCFWSHWSDVSGHLRWVLGSLTAAILPLSIDSFTNDPRMGGGHCGALLYPPVIVYITIENNHVQWKILYKSPFSIAMLNYQMIDQL
jgi:hypothetical protein